MLMNAPLMMLKFYMDAIDKRWWTHQNILHMEIDPSVLYLMLKNMNDENDLMQQFKKNQNSISGSLTTQTSILFFILTTTNTHTHIIRNNNPTIK